MPMVYKILEFIFYSVVAVVAAWLLLMIAVTVGIHLLVILSVFL
jgi:hypothetical protein